MIVLQWCKMQIICMLIFLYIGTLYISEKRKLKSITKSENTNNIFDSMFITAVFAVLFDGITACTVNFLEQVPRVINVLAHLGMFISYEVFVTILFWYWMSATVSIPKELWKKTLFLIPSVLFILMTIYTIPELDFMVGKVTNYSMGMAVYILFGCIGMYFLLTIGVIISKFRYIPSNKQKSLFTTLVCIIIIFALQIIFPEFLVSCIAVAIITISIYMSIEDPAIKALERYHREMVMGFATLVENKDGNTGGHIKRSSAYAVLIAENLRKSNKYKNIITKDFLNTLEQSAPMHDIGKIGIPDVILQKPGKLTAEEFEKMKEHPVIGGKIIKDTFGHLDNGKYENMAYEIAMYHHEKWNGKGYPNGISGEEIPLCARIMSVADVFDAVSAKRCYRDAMPLEQCYSIIKNGKGTDFSPDIVDAFMENIDEIEKIYYEFK